MSGEEKKKEVVPDVPSERTSSDVRSLQYDLERLSARIGLTQMDEYGDSRHTVKSNWQDGDGLCFRCTRAHILRTKRSNDTLIYCNEMNVRMPTDVTECSHYKRPNEMTLHEMASIATLIQDKDGDGGHYI